VTGVVKEHTQPLAQSAVELHLPPQVVLAWLPSWRAEAAPAQRTAVTMVANIVVLAIFLSMVLTPFG